jgi:Na+-transporting methylmalonyl-CoA/oxaloacetate decarboxylase gamma subunit
MNEILLLLLGIIAVIALGCSIVLLALGRMIDQFPTGDESKRTRSIASPIETTKVATASFWVLFIIGGWALLQESRLVMVAGVTTLFAIFLFLFTALVFSFAVLNSMRGRRKGIKMPDEIPVLQLSSSDTAISLSQSEGIPPAPVLRKRYNNPNSNFMLNALLKKE